MRLQQAAWAIAMRFRRLRVGFTFAILVILFDFCQASAQSVAGKTAELHGHVRDASGKPSADATISIRPAAAQRTTADTSSAAEDIQTARTDGEGTYRFASLRAGAYLLHAEAKTSGRTVDCRIDLAPGKSEVVDLALVNAPDSSAAGVSAAQSPANCLSPANTPQFFDEPQFTVAGITQASNSGGHGADNIVRTSEALVKATGSLGRESAAGDSAVDSTGRANLERERNDLQALIRRDDNVHNAQAYREQAERHHRVAQIDERLGDPLEAVREYQRAAEIDPSEAHLFDWASELLTHRALEPATEVFGKGNRLYPQSARMLIGLGVTWYARGSYERASQFLATASDLAPADPTPYLFMGKLLGVEAVPSDESVERLARFQKLAPENASSNYFYALALWKRKQSAGAFDDATLVKVETLLRKAVELDPKMGAAYLQLGMLYAHRGDYPRAISAYQRAINASPDLEEAHYRLAQAYLRVGKEAEAKRELQLHEELAKQSKEQAERQRREIQEFVISLRD